MPSEQQSPLPDKKEESSKDVQKYPWGFILRTIGGIVTFLCAGWAWQEHSNTNTLKGTIEYERARAEKAEATLTTTRKENDDFKDELLIKNNIITDYRATDSLLQLLRKKTAEPTRKILSDAKH